MFLSQVYSASVQPGVSFCLQVDVSVFRSQIDISTFFKPRIQNAEALSTLVFDSHRLDFCARVGYDTFTNDLRGVTDLQACNVIDSVTFQQA